MKASRKDAFTLIELLVALAIVSLLAAILMPIFLRTRELSRRTACLSNLRQIGHAFAAYGADHNEAFPNNGDPYLWIGRRFRWPIMPYLAIGQRKRDGGFDARTRSDLLRCPSDPETNRFDETSYAYSAVFYRHPETVNRMRLTDLIPAEPPSPFPCETQTLASVSFPSQKVLAFEWNNGHDFTGAARATGPWGTLTADRQPGPDRWSGRRMALFVDGHARHVPVRRMTPSVDDAPDPNLTPNGVRGVDLRESP
ncbi:MAG: type II secretion system protein [Capsulimonadales bacterium]|nr:type II secretion system protein [Capsulimonadales bacterium]